MLQASSPLSRVCGHSHFKKFWLMQTQKEAQASVACEKNANLAMSSSRCVPSPPVRGPDSKHDSRWGSGTPSMTTLLREGSSTRNPSSGCGAGKHVSLVTCAESLTSPLQTEPACQSLNQKRSYLNIKDLNNNAEDGFRQPYGAGKSNDIIVTNPPVVNGSKSRVCSSNGSVSKQSNIYPEDAIKSPDPSGSLRLGLDEFRSSSGHQNLVQEANEVKSQGLADLSSKQKDFDPVEECMKFSKRSLAPVSVDNYRGSKDFCKTSKFSTDQESHMSLSRVPMQSEMDKRRDKNALSDNADDDNDDDDSEDGLLEDGKVQDLSKLDSNGVRSCLRTCSHCGTTKTPLWRSGPHGPKSLCNACGIRFKKSRRYIGPVTEGLDSPTSPNSSRSVSKSLKRKLEFTMESHLAHPQEEDVVGTPAIHKRSRWPVRLSMKKDCLGQQADEAVGAESCLTWTIPSETFSSRSRFKLNSKDPKRIKEEINLARMFARDEDEEAAVLLMALSCGLVNA